MTTFSHSTHTFIPVIIGPTAGGKSALALALAGHIHDLGSHAELVSADAYQLYRHMDIGTAKPTVQQRESCVHHLIDIVDPREQCNVSDWLARANDAITDIEKRGAMPIVVGGTLLYAKALIEGMFQGPEPDEALRATLRATDPGALRAELECVDPIAAARLHPNDVRRTVRAIEVFRLTGTPISALQQQWDRADRADRDDSEGGGHRYLLVELDWPVEQINQRINARVKAMVEMGLVDEVGELCEAELLGPTAREAIGYKQLLAHFAGSCSVDDAIERIKIESRRFAKNQRTWLRRLRAHPHTLCIDAPKLVSHTDTQSCVETIARMCDSK